MSTIKLREDQIIDLNNYLIRIFYKTMKRKPNDSDELVPHIKQFFHDRLSLDITDSYAKD